MTGKGNFQVKVGTVLCLWQDREKEKNELKVVLITCRTTGKGKMQFKVGMARHLQQES